MVEKSSAEFFNYDVLRENRKYSIVQNIVLLGFIFQESRFWTVRNPRPSLCLFRRIIKN